MSGLTITLLAGGVGGAKAAEGLAASQYSGATQIIGNVADDEEFHGLWVSSDIDTLIYSLSNQIDRRQGWGRKNETYQALSELRALGKDTWMTLGDLDLATHIYRTELRKQGVRASYITQRLAQRHKVTLPILLPTDDVVQTRVKTKQGWLSFQEYFVRERCLPEVFAVEYSGANTAKATPESLSRIAKSSVIVIAPSNPIVSIGAILAVSGIQEAIEKSGAYVIAVSPLIAGKTIKGPADKMLKSADKSVDSKGIYQCYSSFIHALVIDNIDKDGVPWLHDQGVDVLVTNTLMKNIQDKQMLMTKVIEFAQFHRKRWIV